MHMQLAILQFVDCTLLWLIFKEISCSIEEAMNTTGLETRNVTNNLL